MEHPIGQVPTQVNLGDFLQLRPTASISLADDLHATPTRRSVQTYQYQNLCTNQKSSPSYSSHC